MPGLVAVVGGKHSGKTTLIEHLIDELKSRGHRVGTIKEMVRIQTLDTPDTETDRYTKAGAEVNVAVPREETVIFIKKRLTLPEVLSYFAGIDFVILEGFENNTTLPKIITAKTADETKPYLDSSAIAVSGLLVGSGEETNKAKAFHLPLLSSLTQAKGLADLVEQKAAWA